MAVSPQTAQTNAALRNGFRVGGVVLLVVGLIVFIVNGAHVVHEFSASSDMNSPDFASGPSFGSVLAAMGGFLMIGASLQLLNLGFFGTTANYVAGEGSEAFRSITGDITGGLRDGFGGGLGAGMGAGVGAGADAAAPTGPYCSRCGVRNDAGARFCDACGTALTAV